MHMGLHEPGDHGAPTGVQHANYRATRGAPNGSNIATAHVDVAHKCAIGGVTRHYDAAANHDVHGSTLMASERA